MADEEKGQPAARPKKRILISVIGTLAILIAAVFVIYPFLFKRPEGKMVVAVLPFQNITSAELRSDINIQGSILMTGSKVQIIAQINDSRKDAVLSSIKFYGPRDDEWILKIMDSLSLRIKNYMLISNMIKGQAPAIGEYAITTSADALKYYLNGEKAFSKSDFHGVIRWDTKALESDSNFIAPLNDITWAYMNLHLYDQVVYTHLQKVRKAVAGQN